MSWKCNDYCNETTVDPFSGENLGPREPVLLWPDDTCRCGAKLEGDQRIVGECRECESAPACWEG